MTLSSLSLFHNDGPQLTIRTLGPAPTQSFDWSDFPLVGQYDTEVIAPSATQAQQRACCEPPAPPLSAASSMEFSTSSSTSVSSSSLSKSDKKSVSFAPSIEICEYAIVVAQHPFCRDALGLSLSWAHAEPVLADLDQYEKERSAYRRKGDHLRLSYWERKNLLRRVGGYTEADLREYDGTLYHSHPTLMDLCQVE